LVFDSLILQHEVNNKETSMSSCRLCNSSFIEHWTARDAKSGESLSMALCGGCGLVQQSVLPTDDALKIYYSHNYREDYKATHKPKPKYVYRAGKTAKDRLEFIERAGIDTQAKRLLDIGAGGGEFCYMASKAGFDAQGIEPHVGYSDHAREQYDIAVRTCGIDDLYDNQVDIVTMFHVFEHLARPADAIKKIWSALNEQGHLVIEVPNIHQADASPHNIYFKAHLFYYSRFSLMAAVSKYFELVAVEDSNNLHMAFRKRTEPLQSMILPSSAQIRLTQHRLTQKGWAEYLVEGGGWKKVFRRVAKAAEESVLGKMPAREILDKVWEKKKQKQHPAWIWVGAGGGLVLAMQLFQNMK